MRAILIDPKNKSVTEIDIAGDLASLQTQVDGYIELVRLHKGEDLYVNEEGLLHERIYSQGFFTIGRYPQPLAGKGVIMGSCGDGKTCASELDIAFVKQAVKFYTSEQIAPHLTR